MINILIRADSSSTIGTGHIMRDLVLASQFKNSNIIFATQDLDGNINKKIIENGYRVKLLKSNDVDEIIKIIQKKDIELVVIDSYLIDYKYEEILKKKTGVKILSFDDTYEKHHCDILLNHNISADKKRYKGLVPKDCELICGKKYTLLRNEFIKEKKKNKKPNKEYKTIFLAMGGADHSNLNIKILKILKKFSGLKVNLVTTTTNQNLKELKKYVKDKSWINLCINSNKIAKLMRKSDFAIVTPSVTLNEIYYMQVPFIAIKTADNQDNIYKYVKKKKFLAMDKFKEKKLEKYINLMLNKKDNIKLINFINLTKKKKKMILKWRNHPSIKKWMYDSDEISLQNHMLFIEHLKDSKDKLYFLIKRGREYIGVVDFTNINKQSCNFGLYSNPKLKGIGNILVDSICKYALKNLNIKKLHAEVFTENEKAIHLYKKFNFIETKRKLINNKEVICMELKNEDR